VEFGTVQIVFGAIYIKRDTLSEDLNNRKKIVSEI
jgi:hypothetical protein